MRHARLAVQASSLYIASLLAFISASSEWPTCTAHLVKARRITGYLLRISGQSHLANHPSQITSPSPQTDPLLTRSSHNNMSAPPPPPRRTVATHSAPAPPTDSSWSGKLKATGKVWGKKAIDKSVVWNDKIGGKVNDVAQKKFGTEHFWPVSNDFIEQIEKAERILRAFTGQSLRHGPFAFLLIPSRRRHDRGQECLLA